MPGIGHVALHVEEPDARARQIALRTLIGSAAQYLPALAGGVVEVQDDVGDGIEVELVVLRRQLDTPAADRPGQFERQVTLVAEVQLEHARVVLRTRGRDRLGGRVLADDPWVVGQGGVSVSHPPVRAAGVRRVAQMGVDAGGAAQLSEAALHTGVRADHTRQREGDVLDPPQVVAGIIEVEHPLRDVDFAAAGRLKLKKFERKVQPQRNVLCQFVFTRVGTEVGVLHLAQGEL